MGNSCLVTRTGVAFAPQFLQRLARDREITKIGQKSGRVSQARPYSRVGRMTQGRPPIPEQGPQPFKQEPTLMN